MASVTQLHPRPELPSGYEPEPVWYPPGPSLLELAAGTGATIGTVLSRPAVSRGLGFAFRSWRPRPPEQMVVEGAEGDPGWFGPRSVAWKVQSDTSMFVAGITAFAFQLLHPLALAGVVDHSSFAEDFTGRVLRTGAFLQGITYGSSAEAARRCAQVRRVHERVRGVAPDGRPYDASEPSLLEWVHLGEYLAIAAAYRRFGPETLTDEELDRYVAEVAVAGVAVGVPDPPRSWAELDAALQRQRPALAIGEQALSALRFLAHPPGLPAAARPAWRLAWAGAVACLPPWAQRLARVDPPASAELVACRSMLRSLQTLGGTPPPLRAARARLGLSP